MSLLDGDELRQVIRQKFPEAGSGRRWAEQNDVHWGVVSAFLNGGRRASDYLAGLVGYRPVIRYERRPDRTTS